MNDEINHQILLLGSSNACLAVFENNKLLKVKKVRSNQESLEKLKLNLLNVNCLIISVRPDLNFLFENETNFYFFDKNLATEKFGLFDLYPEMGADRICNLIGAIKTYPAQSVGVFDLGTCNTWSLLEYETKKQNYKLKESLIMPGITTSFKAMKQFTTSLGLITELEFIEYCFALSPPKSMKGAICEGQVYLLKSLINSFQLALNKYVPGQLIITGGWSKLFADNNYFNLPEKKQIEPNLALWGAYFYAQILLN